MRHVALIGGNESHSPPCLAQKLALHSRLGPDEKGTALLFGALHKGAAALDLETERVTQELSLVLQALIILSVSAEGLWTWLNRREPKLPVMAG